MNNGTANVFTQIMTTDHIYPTGSSSSSGSSCSSSSSSSYSSSSSTTGPSKAIILYAGIGTDSFYDFHHLLVPLAEKGQIK